MPPIAQRATDKLFGRRAGGTFGPAYFLAELNKSHAAKNTLLTILHFADEDGTLTLDGGIQKLADVMGSPLPGIERCVRTLVRLGLILSIDNGPRQVRTIRLVPPEEWPAHEAEPQRTLLAANRTLRQKRHGTAPAALRPTAQVAEVGGVRIVTPKPLLSPEPTVETPTSEPERYTWQDELEADETDTATPSTHDEDRHPADDQEPAGGHPLSRSTGGYGAHYLSDAEYEYDDESPTYPSGRFTQRRDYGRPASRL